MINLSHFCFAKVKQLLGCSETPCCIKRCGMIYYCLGQLFNSIVIKSIIILRQMRVLFNSKACDLLYSLINFTMIWPAISLAMILSRLSRFSRHASSVTSVLSHLSRPTSLVTPLFSHLSRQTPFLTFQIHQLITHKTVPHRMIPAI